MWDSQPVDRTNYGRNHQRAMWFGGLHKWPEVRWPANRFDSIWIRPGREGWRTDTKWLRDTDLSDLERLLTAEPPPLPVLPKEPPPQPSLF